MNPDNNAVRYAMAASLLARLDTALTENEIAIQAATRRRQALLKERQELIAAISAPPIKLAA